MTVKQAHDQTTTDAQPPQTALTTLAAGFSVHEHRLEWCIENDERIGELYGKIMDGDWTRDDLDDLHVKVKQKLIGER